MRKLIIYLFFLLFFTTTAFSYNATYSNLTLEKNGWCVGIEIPFTVWNSTDYENQDDIRDDDDINFTYPSGADIKIYNGPTTSLPLLTETTTDSDGEFSFTFPAVNQYLIKIEPDGRYNDYEELLEIIECKWAGSDSGSGSNSSSNENKSFDYLDSKLNLYLENSTIENETTINVKEISQLYLESVSITPPEDMVEGFEVGSSSSDFTSLKITFTPTSTSYANLQRYDSTSMSFDDVTYENDSGNIVIENAEYGIYILNSVPVQDDEEETIVTEEASEDDIIATDDEENTQGTTGSSEEESPTMEPPEESTASALSSTLLYAVVGVFVIAGIGFVLYKGKDNFRKKGNKDANLTVSDPAKEDPSKKKEEPHKKEEILTSYNDIYARTKDYVNKHKDSYKKDEIYRVLQNAHIPKDIIDKVFLEIYK